MASEIKLVKEVFSSELTDHEMKTAEKEWEVLKDPFLRQMNSTKDILALAGVLYRVRSIHGKSSTIYKRLLESYCYYNEDWASEDKRKHYRRAYEGYLCLIGSEEEVAAAASSIKSLSGFAALKDVPTKSLRSLCSKLKNMSGTVTAKQIKCFGSYEKFLPPEKKPKEIETEFQPVNFPVEPESQTDEQTYTEPTPAPAKKHEVEVVEDETPIKRVYAPASVPKVVDQKSTILKLKSSLQEVKGFTMPMCAEVRSLIEELYARLP